MDSMEWPSEGATPGVLHYIPPNLAAFEPSKPLVRSGNINTLLWIGGMFDTFGSVSYPFTIAQSLPMTWSLATVSLGSAGLSWGVGSIAQDAKEVGKIVAYFQARRPGGQVVIMGHSTGCQDCMEYLVGDGAAARPRVDGVILQAPVSDREALEVHMPTAQKDEADQLALKMQREGKGVDALPNRLASPVFGRIAITASRWIDVSSPAPNHSGADDYFSSDLPIERLRATFGKLKTPLLILYSGSDDSMPKGVDMNKITRSWADVVKYSGGRVDDEHSGLVPGASHNCNGNPENVIQDLVTRVSGFVAKLDHGDFGDGAASSL